jgi:hypothetical protein
MRSRTVHGGPSPIIHRAAVAAGQFLAGRPSYRLEVNKADLATVHRIAVRCRRSPASWTKRPGAFSTTPLDFGFRHYA